MLTDRAQDVRPLQDKEIAVACLQAAIKSRATTTETPTRSQQSNKAKKRNVFAHNVCKLVKKFGEDNTLVGMLTVVAGTSDKEVEARWDCLRKLVKKDYGCAIIKRERHRRGTRHLHIVLPTHFGKPVRDGTGKPIAYAARRENEHFKSLARRCGFGERSNVGPIKKNKEAVGWYLAKQLSHLSAKDAGAHLVTYINREAFGGVAEIPLEHEKPDWWQHYFSMFQTFQFRRGRLAANTKEALVAYLKKQYRAQWKIHLDRLLLALYHSSGSSLKTKSYEQLRVQSAQSSKWRRHWLKLRRRHDMLRSCLGSPHANTTLDAQGDA